MYSDVIINNVRLRLDPGHGNMPFEPLVETLSIEISADAFRKIVVEGIRKVGDRVPVEIELGSVRLLDGGAEIVMKVKRSILRAELRIRLAFSAIDPETIRVQVAELDAPAWVPTQFVIEHGMTYASSREGFTRVAGVDSAVDINPATILASRGIPVNLAKPGAWSMETTPQSILVGFGPDR
jgi:hypothetical protein